MKTLKDLLIIISICLCGIFTAKDINMAYKLLVLSFIGFMLYGGASILFTLMNSGLIGG